MLYSNGRREKKKSTRLSTFTDLYYNINGCVAALHTRANDRTTFFSRSVV